MSIIKASFFERLVQLCRVHLKIDIHDLVHDLVKINHVHYHVSDTAPLIQQTDPQTIAFNLKKMASALPPVGQAELEDIIRVAVLEDDIPLLEEKSKNRIEDIELKESAGDTKKLLDFFREKIPEDDFGALRAAIYIKKRFDERAPFNEIYSLKGELMAKYGVRGRKINNLFSSGYFETMIMPLFNEMVTHPGFDKDDFLKQYNLIITEEAFAVFVSGWMMADELSPIIHSKIRKNLKYGINFITIHGIGQENVENIKDILMDIEVNYPISTKNIEEKNNIITAKFWFNKDKTFEKSL